MAQVIINLPEPEEADDFTSWLQFYGEDLYREYIEEYYDGKLDYQLKFPRKRENKRGVLKQVQVIDYEYTNS